VRRIFGPKRNGVAGRWRKLHNRRPHNLNCSPNIISVIKTSGVREVGHVARTGEMGNYYKTLILKPEENSSLRRTRYRWKYNTEIGLKEAVWEDLK
jgi:hypothetical protein